MSTESAISTINTQALGAALYELSEINGFIADMSRILQQEDIMENESIVTRSCTSHIAAAIEIAAKKQLELQEVIESSMGIDISLHEHKPNIQLFDMPSESHFYYGRHGLKGVFSND